jgi:GNAT superfamily N-acetyltransferase
MIIYRERNDLHRANLAGDLRRLIPNKLINENRKLANLKEQVTAHIYTRGMGSFLKEAAKKLRRMVVDYRVMFVMEHTGAPPQTIALPSDVTIEHLGEDDIELIGSFLGFEPESRKHQVIRRRFANGGECFIVRYEGAIAAICWGMFKEDYLTDIGKWFPLRENEIDLGDAFTSPVFRGRGLLSILIKYCVRRYAEKNLRIVATILSNNIASLKSVRKNGFAPVGKIRSLRLFGLKIL